MAQTTRTPLRVATYTRGDRVDRVVDLVYDEDKHRDLDTLSRVRQLAVATFRENHGDGASGTVYVRVSGLNLGTGVQLHEICFRVSPSPKTWET